MKLNNYLRISEAAEFLGVCKATLRHWDNIGKLKANKTPTGRRLYTKEQLESVLHGVRNSAEGEV